MTLILRSRYRIVADLIDIEVLSWEQAWRVTQATVPYTNHTVLPGALEKWSLGLFQRLLPRHTQIIEKIDEQFLSLLAEANVFVWVFDCLLLLCFQRLKTSSFYLVRGRVCACSKTFLATVVSPQSDSCNCEQELMRTCRFSQYSYLRHSVHETHLWQLQNKKGFNFRGSPQVSLSVESFSSVGCQSCAATSLWWSGCDRALSIAFGITFPSQWLYGNLFVLSCFLLVSLRSSGSCMLCASCNLSK